MTAAEFADLALSLPGVSEGAHFGKCDFRAGGKVFASLPSGSGANLKLTPDQQMMMVEMHAGLFSALPNAWGRKGWTALALDACPSDIARSALIWAVENVAPKPGRQKA